MLLNKILISLLTLLVLCYCNTATARYVQSDPIGLEGGVNTYGYVGGNPVNQIDPNGTNAVAGAVEGAEAGGAVGGLPGAVVGGVVGGVAGAVASGAISDVKLKNVKMINLVLHVK